MKNLRITSWHKQKDLYPEQFTTDTLTQQLSPLTELPVAPLRRLALRIVSRSPVEFTLRKEANPANLIAFLASFGAETSVTPLQNRP